MMAHQPRTPSAWIILLARFHSHKNTPAAWMNSPLISLPVPSPVLRVGHFSRDLLVCSCQAPKAQEILGTLFHVYSQGNTPRPRTQYTGYCNREVSECV